MNEISPESSLLAPFFTSVEACLRPRWEGRIQRVSGTVIESEGPSAAVGEMCEVISQVGSTFPGEVVGFRGSTVLSMLLGSTSGIHYGDRIRAWGARPALKTGPDLLGRVINGEGVALDAGSPISGRYYRELSSPAPLPMEREPVHEPVGCGIRAIDGFLTCGRGQRIGIFGGSGVGKSTLIGMMARNTGADMTVLALVGERGREVRHFLEDVLGEEGRKRSVVVVSTSDQSPLLRIRAALAATAAAEYFCASGKNVLLILDSLTRLAMAQREIGLAAGEPPTSKGYTPSVFSLMARLIERAGKFQSGSITAFYTVLMEGDDQQDPVVDGARALLDGHIILDRRLAAKNHYPPIALLDSISRLMSDVASPEHLNKARSLRHSLAAYAASEDLIRIGAYQKGSDPQLDQAMAVMPELNNYLQQSSDDAAPLTSNVQKLLALPT